MRTTLLTFTTLLLGTATCAFAQNPDRPGPRAQRPAPEAVAALLVTQFDVDQDGALSATEFETAMREHRKMMRANRPDRENRPGKNGDEMGRPRGPRNPEKHAERLQEAFTTADADDSGALTEAELAFAIETMRPPRGPRGPRGPGGSIED